MLHKLRATDAPRLGALERITPDIAEDPEVRVHGVFAVPGGLGYRAEGAAPGGVYVERRGRREMLLPDTEQHLILSAQRAGRHVGALAARQGSLPGRPDAAVFVALDDGTKIGVPGQAFAVSGDGQVAVVADVDGGRLVRVDLVRGDRTAVAPLVFEAQEQLAPLLSVDAHGKRAYVMQVEAGRVTLTFVDLVSGEVLPMIEGLPEPSWALGAHLGKGGPVALEMVHDEVSRFRILRFDAGRPADTLLTLKHGQPASPPVRLKTGWMAVVLSLEAHRFTDYGPTDVVAVPLGGGAHVKLTDLGDVRGRLRVDGEHLLVEGGEALLRWRIPP